MTTMERRPDSRGKVRDIYDAGENLLMVATDRISAFDFILPDEIPFKGEVLNRISAFWFDKFADIVPNHLVSIDPADFPEEFAEYRDYLAGRAMLVKKAQTIPIECIVRGYLTGSGKKTYDENGTVCGIQLPEGLTEASKLPEPLFTPSTKAEIGDHDENISFEQSIDHLEKYFPGKGREYAELLRDSTIALYKKCAEYALAKGIIIADTKFEFGLDEEGNLVEKPDEEKAAEFETAKADALALAQELQAKLTAGSDAQALAEEYGDKVYNSSAHISAVGSNFASAQYADWLYDASRKAGDVTLAENDRSDSFVYNYYVVQFDSRARDESSTADVRHILIGAGSNPTEEQYAAAEESAQAMLDQWKAEGGTEDAFALLAMENTADSGSQATGGLYTGVSSANAWDQNFLDWALDPADRKSVV